MRKVFLVRCFVIAAGVLIAASSVQAATTISTDIQTGGQLSVTGSSTLSGPLILQSLASSTNPCLSTNASGVIGLSSCGGGGSGSFSGDVSGANFFAASSTGTSTFAGALAIGRALQSTGSNLSLLSPFINEYTPVGDYNKFDMTTDGLAVITAGNPFAESGGSNSESVLTLGNILFGNSVIFIRPHTFGAQFNLDDTEGIFDFVTSQAGDPQMNVQGYFNLQLTSAAQPPDNTGQPADVTWQKNNNPFTISINGDAQRGVSANQWGRNIILNAEGNENGGTGGDIILNPGIGDSGQAAGNIIMASSTGNVGIGTTTPGVMLQVTTQSSNATTSIEIGKAGQTKGSCLVLYDSAGSPIYAFVKAGATTFTLSTISCK